MRFAHMADCHIGAWRDPKMKSLNLEAFRTAVKICAAEKVDFILISGDLFNTALPGIDKLKEVAGIFRRLKEKGIRLYLIPGSHDFSPSGRTMLDVLAEAGLCKNVFMGNVVEGKLRLEVSEDESGAKIAGMLGRRGMLERNYYVELDRAALEELEGFKIFMFHTALDELKPTKMERIESSPISLLPKGFDYYAGGHVHIVEKKDLPGYKNVVYPGPLFPNSFSELEELHNGGFYIYDNGKIVRKEIKQKAVKTLSFDATGKVPGQVTQELIEAAEDCRDALVLIRVGGILESGRPSDVDYKKAYNLFYEKGAYFVMRNTAGFSGPQYEEIEVESRSSDELEADLIEENVGTIKVAGWDKELEEKIIKDLMRIMASEKKEGEKVYEYEKRIVDEAKQVLDV